MKLLRKLWNALAAPYRRFCEARSKAICEDACEITDRIAPMFVTILDIPPDSKEAEAIWTMVFTTVADHNGRHRLFSVELGQGGVRWRIHNLEELRKAAHTAAQKYGRLY